MEDEEVIDLTVHQHEWKVFNGFCVCVGRCFRWRHPYGMFDDCGEH